MSTNDPQVPGETPSWNQPNGPIGGGPTDPPSGGGFQTPPPNAPRESNTLAIVLLVLGVLELLLVCCCSPGALGGVAAIIFAILALSKRKSGDEGKAKTFQKAAIISLVVGLILFFIFLAIGVSQFDFSEFQNQLDQLENTGTLPEQ